MASDRPDAIVIGTGPNGLAAANVLADAGWEVVVLEANEQPGGACRSGALTEPGFVHDLFSSFYPLGAASPAMRALDLERHGLRWRNAPLVVAHPAPDGSCAVLSRDLDETAASLDAFAAGDGDAWRRLAGLWERVGEPVLETLMSPFPPVEGAARLVRRLGVRGLLSFGRFAMLPVRRLGQEAFRGEGGRRLLAGNALHADLSPDMPGGAVYGWVLCGLGQGVGFPVPEGGAGRLTGALLARMRLAGAELRCGQRVTAIDVEDGRAVGVRTADGTRLGARRAVLADVGAPALYRELLPDHVVPARLRADLERFQYDSSTVKVDWALDGPIPWSAADARRAGTVHVSDSVDTMADSYVHLASKRIPDRPFLVMGQYAAFDPSRQPPGKETAWAYTHVPQDVRADAGPDGLQGRWDDEEAARFADRMEAEVEALAPGFGRLIRARHIFTPLTMQAENANLVGGALNGGTTQIHQQLVFRPTVGLGRPETPIPGLYLASASAHPGGGVHGACGTNAARAALAGGPASWAVRRLASR